ncbi:cation transporter [Flavobacterium sp. H122]|uniref:cation transporter n=1 Tax=Flavobacterium sp. H122 TaxID=2529860 RepID=UPI0010AA1953|nr:cation transporter [Flavobacterium sp. H122]
MKTLTEGQIQKLYSIAFGLSLITVFYNIAEGIISTYFGFEDESLVLFGFGIDSFIEVISGLGITHMILRIRKNPESKKDNFENQALRITGFSFFLLAGGLIISVVINIYTHQQPETTFWGIIISILSILVMWTLITAKTNVGKKLNSHAIIADAQCTKVCLYMSIVLLTSSGIYYITHFPYIDSIGTIGIAYFALKEGLECFEKAKSNNHRCDCQ